MSRSDHLRALEQLLESFVERVVAQKESRLRVLTGINRLDDIARGLEAGQDLTDAVGGWFAEHQRWLHDNVLRPGDQTRIHGILGAIRRELQVNEQSSPAVSKVAGEIDRWTEQARPGGHRVVLKRGQEIAPPPSSEAEVDSITRFREQLERLGALYADMSGGRAHVISVLNESLDAAIKQRNPDALLLAGLLIYYLRHRGYLVAPFVKRLKEAEATMQGNRTDA
jgi:hypothetical protein